MKTNVKKLVKMSVQGQVSPPVKGREYTVKHDGQPMVLPGVGGITYNVKIGDPVMDWVADHVEPGVSMKITGSDRQQAAANAGTHGFTWSWGNYLQCKNRGSGNGLGC